MPAAIVDLAAEYAGLALVLAAYALGSISFAILIAKRRGIDLRGEGSGNLGATNVGRVIGKREGRIVLVADALKGALPALLARFALGEDTWWTAAVGVAAVAGHCFPIWHGLRGGKGAATAAGVMLALVPAAGLAAIAAYVILKRVTRRASAGSLAGALLGAAIAGWLHGLAEPLGAMGVGVLALVVVRHADNLVRLARGEEPPS